MKRALVTGGAGFLGSHLCERLLKDGYEVVALDNLYTGTRENIASFADDPRFTFVEADVTDPNVGSRLGLSGADEGRRTEDGGCAGGTFDEIYNLACPASPVHYQARPLFTTLTSIKGILLCLDLAKACGAKVLHCSTSEIYGDPLVHPQVEGYWGNVNTIGIRSCYDEGKRVAETLASDFVREYDVDVRMVRIFNTYGPRMHPQDGRVVSNFILQALRNEDITIYGDGSQTRSFQYCDDLIEAFRRYMELPKSRIREFFHPSTSPSPSTSNLNLHPAVPVINTGNPGEYTIGQLAEETIRQVNQSQPRPTSSTLIYKPLPGDDPKKRKPDITLAKELLGWEPKVPLREGLARTVAYFRARAGR